MSENSNTTASIAAQEIARAESTLAESPIRTTPANEAYARVAPQAALAEVRSLAGEGASKTRIAAAMNIVRSDPRNTVMTNDGLIRRELDPDATLTQRIAREMADLQAAGGLNDEDNSDFKRSHAVHSFIRGVFKDAMVDAPPDDPQRYGTSEYDAAADALVDLMIKHGRENR